ncbi:hypothetical protein Fmac_003322 [Flemingia macrophylla]|uniref:Uncharacterized protein n=1 Tax=Flemingia macrophylla TaxID=520843 RepID=A0ABD1NNX0_9FABA
MDTKLTCHNQVFCFTETSSIIPMSNELVTLKGNVFEGAFLDNSTTSFIVQETFAFPKADVRAALVHVVNRNMS